MARGRTVTAALAVATIVGIVLWRRRSRRRERVDLYFADGSMVSFQPSALRSDKVIGLLSDYVTQDAVPRARRERPVFGVSRRAAQGAARRKRYRSSRRPPSSGTPPVCP